MARPAIAGLCSGLVVVLCVVVLAGWQFDVVAMRALQADAPQTTPLTALILLALAGALTASAMISRGKSARRWVWLCRGLAGAGVLAALWEGLQYLVDTGRWLEVALFPEVVTREGGMFPGRPSPQSIASALLVGSSLGLSPTWPGRKRSVVMTLGLMGAVLPWLALFGYASTTTLLYALPEAPKTGMSPLSAIAFLALAVGVVSLRPDGGLIELLTASSPGGQIVRWLLPIALVAPLLMAAVVTLWSSAGFLGTPTGIALSWGVTSLIFAALVLWQGVTVHRYHAALKRQAEALEQSNLELQQFAYVASHDLQAPLRSISGFVQLLQETYHRRLDDEADDWINRTVDSVRRMQAMIRDILAYSRIDSRSRPLVPTALADVLDEVLQVLAAPIADSGATVTCDRLPTVMADRSQLEQLLQNLIQNALKYRGDQSPRVHVSAEKKGRRWVVAVRDNGMGIAPRHRERVFGIFRRLHTHDEYPGTGIGLAVCRRVVERHGGKIWVMSAPGEGSTFCFTLPEEEAIQP